MRISVRNRCSDANTYRAARVKSLFNAETGANFDLDADLEIEHDGDWKIGVVVGPSGSGKTSIGRQFFGREAFFAPAWPSDLPIIDAIGAEADFDAVTGAMASVGLGDVPAWLRPFHALSMGEQFRATLARLVIDAPTEAVVDEFTSVVDRQIARIGALAFAKAWRRGAGRVVLLTPHYDVLEWLEPDWVFDTGTKTFSRRSLRRPRFELEIVKTDWRYWPLFAPHHYLKIGVMPAAVCYVGLVDGEPVAHLGVGCKNKGKSVEARRHAGMARRRRRHALPELDLREPVPRRRRRASAVSSDDLLPHQPSRAVRGPAPAGLLDPDQRLPAWQPQGEIPGLDRQVIGFRHQDRVRLRRPLPRRAGLPLHRRTAEGDRWCTILTPSASS